MLFSKLLKNKFLKAPSVRQNEYSSYVALWAQQILSHRMPHTTYLKVSPDSIKITDTTLTFNLFNNKGTLPATLEFFEDGIVNFTVRNPNNKSEFSFYDVEPRPKLNPYFVHITEQTSTKMTLQFSNTSIYASSTRRSKYKVLIEFEPFKLTVQLPNGKALIEFNANNDLIFTDHILFDTRFPTQHLFGLAERAGHIYLQDTKAADAQREPYKLSSRDHPKYNPFSHIGLYGSVPLVVNLYDETSRALSGVFQANTSETYVEVSHNAVQGSADVTWLNECGDLELFFIASDGLRDFFEKSSRVLGRSYMPPMWALGFHQCRYGYLNEDMMDEVNEKLKEYKVPCDSLTLDIDYTDGFKYFTWHPTTFPDPGAMIERLRKNKRRLICINDPHLKQDEEYPAFKRARENGWLIKNPKGEDFIHLCWPGKSGWVDYTNPHAQEFWASLYHYDNFKHTNRYVHAWNDMNEPAIFNPNFNNTMSFDNRHVFYKNGDKNGEKREVEHRYVHNMYGHMMVKSTFKGMIERDAPNKYRPFILTRSFFAGSQKYAAIWSGDAGSKWEDLQGQVPMALNTTLCGVSFCGGDVGGFMGDPSPECATRWYQVGACMPFFRAHSEMNTRRREPYVYDQVYRDIIIKAIYERYRWLLYYYGVFEDYVRTGYPIMRTVWMETKGKHPVTMSMLQEDAQFFVGDSLLIIPIGERFRRYVQIHQDLQKEEWFTHDFGYVSNTKEVYKTGLERIGMFIRAESIIPLIDVPAEILSTEDLADKPLELFITVGTSQCADGVFYDDDWESFNYEQKEYLRREFVLKDNVLTNRMTDPEQKNENVFARKVSTITLCGTNDEILKWKILNLDEYGLRNHKVDLKKQEYKMIRFTGLDLNVKEDWSVKFTVSVENS